MPNIIDDLQSQINDLTKANADLQAQVKADKVDKARVDALQTQVNNLSQSCQACSGGGAKPIYDCKDLLASKPYSGSGVYTLSVNGQGVKVYCDMTTNGGGWTVFQRRQDGTVDFNRNWANYSAGFGEASGEFWLGNDNLAAIVGKKTPQTLRIELEDWSNNKRYAEYNNFQVLGSANNYKLASLGAYSGDATDSLGAHAGAFFSTFDKDLDTHADNCAIMCTGGWWFINCLYSNLNGGYKNDKWVQGIDWYNWKGHTYSLKFSEMKFRSTA